ncbi:MAG: Ig-like domain-containing protein, partial [Ginsengibacter sp.]
MRKYRLLFALIILFSCSKKPSDTPAPPPPPPPPASFQLKSIDVNNSSVVSVLYNMNTTPGIVFKFSAPVDKATVDANFSVKNTSGVLIPISFVYQNNDSSVNIQPSTQLQYLTKYIASVATGLKSKAGGMLQTNVSLTFVTQIDSTDKFPRISDDALLDLIQKKTFKYFWDFGHPVSGMARERNTSGDVVTTGGTGFSVMSIIVA